MRDARVAEGADPAVQRLRHLEPQIVGTRRRAATSRGHDAAESAYQIPWTATVPSTASVGGPREVQCRSTASLSRLRCQREPGRIVVSRDECDELILHAEKAEEVGIAITRAMVLSRQDGC